jgi:hypothetical protein
MERRAEMPVRERQDNHRENEQAQCFAAEHDERGPRRDHHAAQQDRHDERHPDQRERQEDALDWRQVGECRRQSGEEAQRSPRQPFLDGLP